MATMTLTPIKFYYLTSHTVYSFNASNKADSDVNRDGDWLWDATSFLGLKQYWDNATQSYQLYANVADNYDALCYEYNLPSGNKYLSSISFPAAISVYAQSEGYTAALSTEAPGTGYNGAPNPWRFGPTSNSILKERTGLSPENPITFNNINIITNSSKLYLYLYAPGCDYVTFAGWTTNSGFFNQLSNNFTYLSSYTLTIETIDNTSPAFSNSVTVKRISTNSNESTGNLSNNANIFEGDKLSIIRTIDHGCYTSIATPADGNNYNVNGNITVKTTFSKEVYNINTELPEGISLTITKNGTSVNTCNYNDTLLISWNYNPSQNRRVEFINCTVNSGNLTNNNNQTYNYTVPDLNHNNTITFTATSKQIGGFWVKDSNNNWKIYDIYIMTNNGWKICDPYTCTNIQNNTYTWKMLG